MSCIGLVAHCAALAVQHDMDKAKAADREADDTQVELAMRWLGQPKLPADLVEQFAAAGSMPEPWATWLKQMIIRNAFPREWLAE